MKFKLNLARSTHNKGDASLDRFLREIVVDPVSVRMLTGKVLKEKGRKKKKENFWTEGKREGTVLNKP